MFTDKFAQIVNQMNTVLAANVARRIISNEFDGGRGDPLLDGKVNGKLNLAKFRSLTGDSKMDKHALIESARKMDEGRADVVRELRRAYKALAAEFPNFANFDANVKRIIDLLGQGAIELDIFLQDNTSGVKVQKAANGKGAGVLVPNM